MSRNNALFTPSSEKKQYRNDISFQNHDSNVDKRLTMEDLNNESIKKQFEKNKNIYDTATFMDNESLNPNAKQDYKALIYGNSPTSNDIPNNIYQSKPIGIIGEDNNAYQNKIYSGNKSEYAQHVKFSPSISSQRNYQQQQQQQWSENTASHSKPYMNMPRKPEYTSIDSDFDLSQSKLNRLGIQKDINKEVQDYGNLLKNYNRQFSPGHHQDNSTSTRVASTGVRGENSRLEKYGHILDQNSYSNNSYSNSNNLNSGKANFSSSNSQHQNLNDTSNAIQNKIKFFQQKLDSVEQTMNNNDQILQQQKQEFQQFNQDPYKISLHSIQMQTINNELKQQQQYHNSMNKYNQQQMDGCTENKADKHHFSQSKSHPVQQAGGDTSHFSESGNYSVSLHKLQPFSTGQKSPSKSTYSQSGLKPPISNLANKFGNEEEFKKNIQKKVYEKRGEDYSDGLNLQRLKYYDSFLPSNMKIMNSAFKLLKYKIENREQNHLKNCMSELAYINNEITSNLYDTKINY